MKATARRYVGILSTLALVAAALMLPAAPAAANHGGRWLDVTPEVDSNPAGTSHALTATLHSGSYSPSAAPSPAPADVASTPIDIDFEIESGPGDTDGPTPNSVDMTCTVPQGSSSCTVAYSSAGAGRDIIRAWIDHDKNDFNAEADFQEKRYAGPGDCPGGSTDTSCSSTNQDDVGAGTGDTTSGDNTDVVEKTWTVGGPTNLNCEPETPVNPTTGTGNSETFTCTVTDQFGNPVSGVDIDGENLAGANDPDNSETNATPDYSCAPPSGTNASGQCGIAVSADDGESGSANICFWADPDNDNVYAPAGTVQEDGGDCDIETQGQDDIDLTDTVQKTWQARSASGGGVDAEPETDVNDTGADHTITATVYDQFGAAFVSGTQVRFEFFSGSPSDTDGNTPATPDKTCTTNNSSTCTVTYTSNATGRDRVCVWTNNTPTMTGTNTDGTCDGESLNDADDDPAAADAPEPVNDDQDVVEKVWQDPGVASRLNCEPETDTNPVGSTHTITCTATNEAGTRIEGAQIDFEFTGANDPDGTDSPTQPDATCTTEGEDILTPTTTEEGTCSITHGTGGVGTTSAQGVTLYRAWIDTDKNDATRDDDASEGRDETQNAGAKIEPDNTDVVEKSWVAPPASLTMTPETDSAPVGSCNPFTITVRNASNQPAQGATLDVEQVHERASNQTNNDEPRVAFCTPSEGPNPSDVNTAAGDRTENPDNLGTAGGETTKSTDANGQITIGVRVEPANGSDGTGTVTVSAFFETTDNDDPDSGEPQDTSTKTWTQSVSGRTIDCEPETTTKETGTTHTVTCTVMTSANQPAQGQSVTFTETGAGALTSPATVTTDAQGKASVTSSSNEPGDQRITGTLTESTQNEPDTDECQRPAGSPSGAPQGNCSDEVVVTWTGSDLPECSDNVDNDNDGATDYPDDPDCASAEDDSEGPQQDVPAACADPKPGYNVIVGTPGDDVLPGTEGNDVICALGGDDLIDGLGGDDLILGGGGKDTIDAGAGADTVKGQRGNDNISGRGGNDRLIGGGGFDTLKGNAGDDSLRGRGGDDVLLGGSGNDEATGGSGKDVLKGAGGKDTLLGNKHDDVIKGGAGRDTLKGGSGNDVLNGGAGTDSCNGGSGSDRLRRCE